MRPWARRRPRGCCRTVAHLADIFLNGAAITRLAAVQSRRLCPGTASPPAPAGLGALRPAAPLVPRAVPGRHALPAELPGGFRAAAEEAEEADVEAGPPGDPSELRAAGALKLPLESRALAPAVVLGADLRDDGSFGRLLAGQNAIEWSRADLVPLPARLLVLPPLSSVPPFAVRPQGLAAGALHGAELGKAALRSDVEPLDPVPFAASLYKVVRCVPLSADTRHPPAPVVRLHLSLGQVRVRGKLEVAVGSYGFVLVAWAARTATSLCGKPLASSSHRKHHLLRQDPGKPRPGGAPGCRCRLLR
mmetsp:Transcript_78301/g.241637  ORF Transcript_78301/g.241637 Transcript_78301/m.241637 type:complete len:305 (+) Transcript_78301:244-1158(+)